MTERKPKMRYDYDLLKKYCEENYVILKKDYSKEKVNRETIIEAKCLNCDDTCSNNFRQFISTGSFCKIHKAENRIEKIKQNSLENFGVEHNSQSNEIKNKKIETCLKNFGVEHPSQSQEIREKTKATCLEKYGCENPSQSQEIKDKIKETCLEKYGVEHPQQNADISEKASKNAYKSYDYIFPSGRVERIQGYENYMLNDLLQKEEVQEHDIIVNRSEVPSVWYEDLNGIKHRYFVDCFIKSQNRCIEAKSTWTAEKKKDCIYLKQQTLKNAGYLCEIWIYDGKGQIVEKVL